MTLLDPEADPDLIAKLLIDWLNKGNVGCQRPRY
jgi:hypothetical protein